MSYDCSHRLRFSCDGGTDRVEDVNFYLDKTLVEHGYVRFSRLSEEKFTWRTTSDDMEALSLKFPQTLFTLDVFGPDQDNWREYWLRGLVQRVTGFIHYEAFNPGVLHAP